MLNTIGLDFEFYNSNEKKMDVVAAVISMDKLDLKYNLLNPKDLNDFKAVFSNLDKENTIILAYAAMAESRSLLSLGIDPLQFKWIDLYVEFRMLCNSNNRFNYGEYLAKTGDMAYSTPPNPSLTEEEKEKDHGNHEEVPKNLINAVYKLMRVRLDQEEKDTMRDLILSKDLVKIHAYMDEILDYCASDTKYLRALDIAIQREYEKEGLHDFRGDQLSRGRYSVCTAHCEHLGLPIDTNLLQKIIKQTPKILDLHKEEVNKHFNFFIPDYQRPPIKRKNGSIFNYKMTPAHKDMAAYQAHVESLQISNFPKTKTGKYKLDKDTLEEYGYWGGLEALWKYNKTESSLKWFNKENGDGFFDRVGSDNCVRPYYGIFGTQTGRNAAKAKTFPLAMSSWLRAIIRPDHGKVIIGADFSQQEVYVAAILSKDQNLLNAYNSGDVYLAFAKQANLVPENATKQTHKLERDLCKATVLGLQFGMGATKLQTKLRLDSGKEVSMERTLELIKAHKDVFSTYWKWVYNVTNNYKEGNPLVTTDGWTLFCDNPSIPSVRNFLVQANAASITRQAIVIMTEAGLNVLCGLHDAVYVLSDSPTWHEMVMKDCMELATQRILKEEQTKIRIDFKIISNENTWVEEKGQKEWEKIKEFLQ